MDAGLDSISGTELSNKISAHLSTELSPTLLFDHPSLRSIADATHEKSARKIAATLISLLQSTEGAENTNVANTSHRVEQTSR